MRRRNERELSDERILGGGDFVEQIVKEADENFKKHLLSNKRRREVDRIMKGTCDKEGIHIKELKSGNRRRCIAQVRSHIAHKMVEDYGLTLAETARQLGVSTSAISKILQRGMVK